MRKLTHSARMLVDVRRHTSPDGHVQQCTAPYVAVCRCRTLQMLKLYATQYLTLPAQRNDVCESSSQFLEAQIISSSLDGRTVARRLDGLVDGALL